MFLGPDAGGGVALSNPNGGNGAFLDFGTGFNFAATSGFTFAAWVRVGSRHTSMMSSLITLSDNTENNVLSLVLASLDSPPACLAWFYIVNDGDVSDLMTPDPGAGADGDPRWFFPAGAVG